MTLLDKIFWWLQIIFRKIISDISSDIRRSDSNPLILVQVDIGRKILRFASERRI